jgi:hypothetical protein
MLAFRGQRARLRRDTRASRRIVDPALRQVEPHIDRRVTLAVAQHAEHSDLAVIDFAKPPVLLSVPAGRRRYAHITALRCDPVNPSLLGMR